MTRSNLPLRALAAFEAAARLESFRAAAEELALTPSAVSHQVRILERRLGLRLFDRVGRGVVLSPEGSELFGRIGGSFDALAEAVETAARRGRRPRRSEVVLRRPPPSLAGCWVLPRLPAFLAAHPEIDLRVHADLRLAADSGARSEADGVDLTIGYGDHVPATAVPLLTETVQPLCAPALAARADPRAPRGPPDLPLIVTRDNRLSWEVWFRRQGVALDDGFAGTIQLDPSHVAIEAAVKGLGVVLESDVLAGDALRDGRLVAPFPGLGVTWPAYWLAVARGSAGRESVETVRVWLLGSAARTAWG
ncbi:LysR substrate-binding domain-containing protein [Inquilinus sp. Marseille-Q2685]|uniref:LysR substrate-binding domain-containing protein n=1 Tax=Inquilinus sp. Marseille-Q2685 TaxID=2866581 RepID=UPI001CE3ED61|nr:LysR substrate-binding domain-containing protein [Inquilinus sp. Marseille-Q2685]